MTKTKTIYLILFLLCLLYANISCQNQPEPTIKPKTTATLTAKPTEAIINWSYTCADIDTHWGQDWIIVLMAIDYLLDQGETCGAGPLLSKKYAAHFNYATSAENSGEIETAIENYTAAFEIDPNRNEALNALIRLNHLPEATPVSCMMQSPPPPDPLPKPLTEQTDFVRLQGDKFSIGSKPFSLKGVNYYPRNAPWHRFLPEANLGEVAQELDLIEQAGFNTIRIFLWYEALFICKPEDAVPNKEAFEKVDSIIQMAHERGLKIIVTLNDLPDLVFRPIYTDWAHYDAQTEYIIQRYKNVPTILAWDLRNEGDLDYGARAEGEARFTQDDVLSWLSHVSQIVRANDQNHLLTAGWWGDPLATEPAVDFLSFHHWYDADSLKQRIESYSAESNKPIVLEEIGYHSWANASTDARDEETQATLLEDALRAADESLAGWVVWAAFDFAPQPGQEVNYEHHFGLWRYDLSAKPSLLKMMP